METNNDSKLQLIQAYRRLFNGRFIEHRSTFLSDVDQLAAIQLAVLLVQKKLKLSEALSPADLFMLQQKIVSKKSLNVNGSVAYSPNIPNTDLLEVISFDKVFESYTTFIKQCNMIDRTDAILFLKDLLSSEDDGIVNSKFEFNKELLNQVKQTDISASPVVSQSPSNPSVLQLRRVVLAYLQLLVNSKDEVALARVVDVPTRGITHRAFTDIRMLAASKSMPMFQIVSSFVRQLILGGKGYAPDENHALYRQREGLMEFMELMDKIQGALDEEPDIKSVIVRIFKQLKLVLVRAKTPVYSNSVVDTVFSELLKKARCFFEITQNTNDVENILKLRDFLDYMNCLWGNDIGMNSSQLCGVLSTPQVSGQQLKRVPTLATQFTTPEATKVTPKKATAKKRRFPESPCVNEKQSISCDEARGSTPLTVRNYTKENIQDASPDAYHPPLRLIRCHEVDAILPPKGQVIHSNKDNARDKENNVPPKRQKQLPTTAKTSTTTKTAAKTKSVTTTAVNLKRPANKKVQKKSKVSKKLNLPSGQKTLTQFFS